MKKQLFGFGIITLVIVSACQSNQKPDKSTSDIIGLYEYTTGDLEGFALYDETHFAFTFRNKLNKPDSALTCEEKYNSIHSNAGTWSLKDSIVTCTLTFHKNPKMIGTSFRFVYDTKGNEFKYRLIDHEGKTIGQGTTLRIK